MWSAWCLPQLCIRMCEVGGCGGCRVPAVEKAVVLEAASTEEGLVGVERMAAGQRGYGGATCARGQTEGAVTHGQA